MVAREGEASANVEARCVHRLVPRPWAARDYRGHQWELASGKAVPSVRASRCTTGVRDPVNPARDRDRKPDGDLAAMVLAAVIAAGGGSASERHTAAHDIAEQQRHSLPAFPGVEVSAAGDEYRDQRSGARILEAGGRPRLAGRRRLRAATSRSIGPRGCRARHAGTGRPPWLCLLRPVHVSRLHCGRVRGAQVEDTKTGAYGEGHFPPELASLPHHGVHRDDPIGARR